MILKLPRHHEETLKALKEKTANVCVIGLGYAGLPLVPLLVKAGYNVTGFDIDQKKVDHLTQGQSYIKTIPDSEIQEMLNGKRFQATTDAAKLDDMHAIIVCVPTPLTEHYEPDMTYVEKTTETVRDHLQQGQLIILESTTYPGTLRTVMKPILEETGMKAGVDFFMGYSPEREDPGNPTHSAAFVPKVVGGHDSNSHALACELYTGVVPEVVPVSSPEVAEACKILENTYRAVNIALVNELKVLFDRMGIDIWEVIDAAKTKPFGFQAFYPGPGLGGHCIPIDPFYLSWVARKFRYHTRFIELAGEVNTAMPEYVIQRLTLALNSQGKSIQGSRVGILGVSYKKNVDDVRESPSLELYERLQQLGAEVSYHDPHVPRLAGSRKSDVDQLSQPLTPEWLESVDAILIATDHDDVDYQLVVDKAALVVDTRNVIRRHTGGTDVKVWAA